MGFTPKQQDFINAVKADRSKDLFFLVGGAGSGKTYAPLALFHRLCLEYEDLRFVVIRKTERNLKRNVIPSYNKVKSDTDTKDSSRIVDMVAKYCNTGSEIIFQWSDLSKDPDLDNIKGLEITGALIDEINQCEQTVLNTVRSRTGRWNLNKKHILTGQICNIPPFTVATCNPNKTWVKTEYYDKFHDGTLPAHVWFQESLPDDNLVNLGEEYVKILDSLPESEKKRYRLNLWDYDEDPGQLITYEWYKNCMVETLEGVELTGVKLLGIDPTDEGSDKTIFCYMQGNTVYKWEDFYKQNEIKTAHIAKERIKEHGLEQGNIAIDSIGVGAGCANTLKEDGFRVYKFVGGEAPESKLDFYQFRNKRAEAAWKLREAFLNQDIVILHHPEAQRQILAQTYNSDDKVITLTKKMVIKSKLGCSPDYFDSLMMCNYLRYVVNRGAINRDVVNNPQNYFFSA